MANVYGFDPVAYSIDGGRHRGELQRVQLYSATGGSEGIIEAPDCKVRQLSTAGTQVRIDAGALLIRNRSASVRNQTYAANGRIESRLDVPAAPAGGRADLVVVRVEDPQYSPWPTPPAGTAPDYQYVKPFLITNVPASTTTALSLNLNYSAVELARINLPANAVNITDAMITDLRKLAQPKRGFFLERYDAPDPSLVDTNTALNAYVQFPPTSQIANASVPVPIWATRANVRVLLTGVQVRTSALAGRLRLKMTGGSPSTSVYTRETYLNEQTFNGSRFSYEITSEVLIPASMRGFTLTCNTEWVKRGGTGFLRTEGDVQSVVDITFLEIAE